MGGLEGGGEGRGWGVPKQAQFSASPAHWLSLDITGYHWLSMAINGYQWLSALLLRLSSPGRRQPHNQPPFLRPLFAGYHWLSLASSGYHWLSIEGYLRYFFGHHYQGDGLCSKYAPAVTAAFPCCAAMLQIRE